MGGGGVSSGGGSGGAGGASSAGGGMGGQGGTAGAGGVGGVTPMGGAPGTGGMSSMGGAPGTGGMMAMGGMPPAPPGPVAAPTQAALFPGISENVAKVVPEDAMPGYFYGTSPEAPYPTVASVMLPSNDAPAGITHAQRTTMTSATNKLLILGWNFRANDGMAFRWVDAGAYAGLTFWMKIVGGPVSVLPTAVDATNVPVSDPAKGTCPTPAGCPPVTGAPEVVVGPTWVQFKVPFSSFTAGMPDMMTTVEKRQLARIDLLFVLPEWVLS
jgi:hypothetical protein